MKRFTFYGMILFLLFNLTACGTKEESKTESKETTTSEKVEKGNKKPNKPEAAKQQETQKMDRPASGNTTQTAQKNTKAAQPAAPPAGNTAKPSVTEPKPATTTKPAAPAPQSKTAPKPAAAATAKPVAAPKPAAAPAPKPAAPKPAVKPPAPVHTVVFSITGPKDKGTILSSRKVVFTEGDTILNILLKAAGKSNVDYSGSGSTAYVEGIDGIYEFDYGPMSGWIFKQNGAGIPKSAGAIKVKDGDRIECIYKEK